MKKILLALLLSANAFAASATHLGTTVTSGTASVGTTSQAAASAVLDTVSTTKGFLPPRMTTTQRNAISSPATGLTIYNTTTGSVEFYTGSVWISDATTNTANACALRDASGNFSAGTITASLTGTASGNTTYTANNHGVVVSGSGNAMTVIAPDASTTKVLTSGGLSADPSWTTAGAGTVTSVTFTGDGTVLSSTPSSAVTSSGTVTASLSTQSARKFLQGPLSGSAAAPTFSSLIPPTQQSFTSNGASGTYRPSYVFFVSSASATAGATYTNNSVTFTVSTTISSGTILVATATSTPLASGTLTKATGTGDSTITFSAYTNSPLYIDVEGAGSGGAGGGGDNVSGGAGGGGGGYGGYFRARIVSPAASYTYALGGGASGGSAGNPGGSGNPGAATTFGTSFLTGNGGSGGGAGVSVSGPGNGGAGGTASGGDLNMKGAPGAVGIPGLGGVTQGTGGAGASGLLGTGGLGGAGNGVGANGDSYGSGGGGGSGNGGTSGGGAIFVREYWQ